MPLARSACTGGSRLAGRRPSSARTGGSRPVSLRPGGAAPAPAAARTPGLPPRSVTEYYGSLLRLEQQERRLAEERRLEQRSELIRLRAQQQEELQSLEEERSLLLQMVQEKDQLLAADRAQAVPLLEQERAVLRSGQDRLRKLLLQHALHHRELVKEVSALLMEREQLKKEAAQARGSQARRLGRRVRSAGQLEGCRRARDSDSDRWGNAPSSPSSGRGYTPRSQVSALLAEYHAMRFEAMHGTQARHLARARSTGHLGRVSGKVRGHRAADGAATPRAGAKAAEYAPVQAAAWGLAAAGRPASPGTLSGRRPPAPPEAVANAAGPSKTPRGNSRPAGCGSRRSSGTGPLSATPAKPRAAAEGGWCRNKAALDAAGARNEASPGSRTPSSPPDGSPSTAPVDGAFLRDYARHLEVYSRRSRGHPRRC